MMHNNNYINRFKSVAWKWDTYMARPVIFFFWTKDFANRPLPPQDTHRDRGYQAMPRDSFGIHNRSRGNRKDRGYCSYLVDRGQ
jgi:hypothetical protein